MNIDLRKIAANNLIKGFYQDTFLNQKLKRVGQEYDLKKEGNKSFYSFNIKNNELVDKNKFEEIGLHINHVDDLFTKNKNLVDYYIFSSKFRNRNQRKDGRQLDNNVYSDYKYIPGDGCIRNTRVQNSSIKIYGINNWKANDFYQVGYILQRIQLNPHKIELLKKKKQEIDLNIKISEEIEKILNKNIYLNYSIDKDIQEIQFEKINGEYDIYEIDLKTGSLYKK